MTLLRFGGGVALVIASARLSAQLPPLVRAPIVRPLPALGTVGEAVAPAVRGDTATSIAALRALVRREPRNAEAWHRLGLLLWQTRQPERRAEFIGSLDAIKDLALADTAFRMAIQLEPKRPEYRVSLGRYHLQSGVSTARLAGVHEMSRGLELALEVRDSALVALSAMEVGLAEWRRYTHVNNLADPGAFFPHLQDTEFRPRRKEPRLLLDNMRRITPRVGRAEYEQALERFRIAEQYDPASLRSSRLLYMALSEGARWGELLEVAERRARASQYDGQARFARGLAQVRLGRFAEGRASFDTAMLSLDDEERLRLFAFTRAMRPADPQVPGVAIVDSASVQRLSAAEQEALTRLFWAVRDPTLGDDANEIELEFLSRVVESELRWSDDDQLLRGADSDRGNIFIRYGPPIETFTLAGSASPGHYASNTLVWRYPNDRLFFFDVMPGFGTARIAFFDRPWVEAGIMAEPALWANVNAPREVASIRTRLTRFRRGRDSMDLVIASAVPADSLLAIAPGEAAVSGREIGYSLRLFDQAARVVQDSTVRIAEDLLRRSPERALAVRVRSAAHVLRVDAVEAETQRVTRGIQAVEGALPMGFTISDVLLTDGRAAPEAASATSFRDVRVTPRAGVFARGEKIGLLWETYEPTAAAADAGGAHRYRISIGLQRVEGSGLGAIALRVRDGVGRLLAQDRGRRDRITVSYDRTERPRDTHVEYLTLDGIDGTPGPYRLTLTVRDLVSGREVTRTAEIVVR